MDKLPERLKIASWYRGIYQRLEKKLWLPRVNPSVYQVIAILLSFAFLLIEGKWTKFLLVLLIILLDWLDGATARRYGLSGEMGYMIDVVVDRFSELIMFYPVNGGALASIWFSLALFNLALSFLSYKTGKHAILPLRFVYLFYIWI